MLRTHRNGCQLAQGPQKWNSMSPGQAAVQLFWRLNHARQTVDFVRRQIARFGKLDRAAMSVMEALGTLNTLREYESALLSEGAHWPSHVSADCGLRGHVVRSVWQHFSSRPTGLCIRRDGPCVAAGVDDHACRCQVEAAHRRSPGSGYTRVSEQLFKVHRSICARQRLKDGSCCAAGSPAQGAELDSDMPLLGQAFQTAEACRLAYPGQDWLHLVRAACRLVSGQTSQQGLCLSLINGAGLLLCLQYAQMQCWLSNVVPLIFTFDSRLLLAH